MKTSILTKKEFMSIISLYDGVLKGRPTKKEALLIYYDEINCLINFEQFERILEIHRKRSEFFPSISDILSYIKPTVLYTVENIFDRPVTENQKLVRDWCEQNYNCLMPKEGTFEFQALKVEDLKWIKINQKKALKDIHEKINSEPFFLESYENTKKLANSQKMLGTNSICHLLKIDEDLGLFEMNDDANKS